MRADRQKIEVSYQKISFFAIHIHEPKMKRIHQILFISIALSILQIIESYSIGDVDPRVSCVCGMISMLYCDVYDVLIHQLLMHNFIAGSKWCMASNFT